MATHFPNHVSILKIMGGNQAALMSMEVPKVGRPEEVLEDNMKQLYNVDTCSILRY